MFAVERDEGDGSESEGASRRRRGKIGRRSETVAYKNKEKKKKKIRNEAQFRELGRHIREETTLARR